MQKIKKENVKVLLKDAIEAKQVRIVLKALGEEIDDSYQYNDHHFFYFNKDYSRWCMAYGLYPCTVLSLKELIILLSTEIVEKPSLLSGRVAIQVNNEREFELLMAHYEKKGWVWKMWRGRDMSRNLEFPYSISYGSDFTWARMHTGCDIIPFDQFAAEVGTTVPVLVMISEDGVPLYHGDQAHHVYQGHGSWNYNSHYTITSDSGLTGKTFSSKESAEAFIAANNKPKEVYVALNGINNKATVSKNKITVSKGGELFFLDHADVLGMAEAVKSLQPAHSDDEHPKGCEP